MFNRTLMRTFVLLTSLVLGLSLRVAAAGNPDEFLTKARQEYPTPLCIVSGEHFEPGKIVEYVHQEAGKPDRLVRFCCTKCETRFKANPTKYLAKLDAAAAAKKGRPAQ